MDNRIWDYTTLSVFQTCRKKYYYFAVRQLRPKVKAPALSFGGAIHDALDAYYSTKSMDAGISAFKKNYSDIEGDDLRTVENGVNVLEHYAQIYKHEPFEPATKPEEGFAVPIGDIMWGGRVDLPVNWNGQNWVMEHKTTTILRSNYPIPFTIDKQLTSYVVGMELLTGKKYVGCIVNVLEVWKKNMRITSRTKTPEQRFARFPFMRSKMLKERFKLNILRIVRDIKWCEENNEFYEAENRDACFTYNKPCPYLDLCRYGASEEIIKRDFVEEVWQPYKQKEVNNE